ncbi:TM2 domain-containing protein DDB_G0278163 [Triticum aestivum]|uniref:TM2 domain-containing protein DDB_G0278163 n=1 Tax=Triticum aestivum TaxID=4565 RepID=UPI001D028C27|nr:TM2 domain-containing protein DDB_G0278163-like [Triticum aestivum]
MSHGHHHHHHDGHGHHHGHHHHHGHRHQHQALPGFPVPFSQVPATVGAPFLEPRPDSRDSSDNPVVSLSALVGCWFILIIIVVFILYSFFYDSMGMHAMHFIYLDILLMWAVRR